MAATNTNTSTKAKNSTEIPDLAQRIREQLVSSVQQGQQLSVEAAENWVKAVSALPVPAVPSIPGAPAFPGAEAVTSFTFDLATDLLNAQREYALRLTNVLVPQAAA